LLSDSDADSANRLKNPLIFSRTGARAFVADVKIFNASRPFFRQRVHQFFCKGALVADGNTGLARASRESLVKLVADSAFFIHFRYGPPKGAPLSGSSVSLTVQLYVL
jgi:hypothetical protein